MKHKYLLLMVLVSMTLKNHAHLVYSDSIVEIQINQNNPQAALTRLLMLRNETKVSQPDSIRFYYSVRLSNAAFILRKLDSAKMFALEALKSSNGISDTSRLSRAWWAAACAYNQLGELDSCLYFNELIQKSSTSQKDIELKQMSIILLANVNMQNGQLEKALMYNKMSLSMSKQSKDPRKLGSDYFNVGLTFIEKGMPDSSIIYLQFAEPYAIECNNKTLQAFIYGTLAEVYNDTKDEIGWKKNIEKAISIAKEINNNHFLVMAYANTAEHALGKEQYEETLTIAQKAIDLLRKDPFPQLEVRLDSMMYVANKHLKHYAAAIDWAETYFISRYEIVNQKQARHLDSLNIVFDVTDMKEQLLLQEKKNSLNRTLIFFVIFGISLTIGLSFVMMVKLKRRKSESLKMLSKASALRELASQKPQKCSACDIVVSVTSVPDDQSKVEGAEPITNKHQEIFQKAINLIETKKLYLDPNMNQRILITLLGTNKKYLYYALHENSDTGFQMFINQYRIEEAKRLIIDYVNNDEEINLSELSIACGFNSDVTFYRSFKAFTKLTPIAFIKKIKQWKSSDTH